MAIVKPNICGNPVITVPDDDCDCCDILTAKVEDIEDVLEEHDERITANTNNFSNYYDKQTIDAKLDGKTSGISVEVVDSLPDVGDPNTFYYLRSADNALVCEGTVCNAKVCTSGVYEKWIYQDGKWYNLGSEELNLDEYVKTTGEIKEYDELTLKVPNSENVDTNVKILGKGDITEIDFSTLVQNLVNNALANHCPYQVGETVIRTDNVDPSTTYSGTTWKKISEGRMLIGANSTYALGSTGGQASVTLNAAQSGTQAQTLTSTSAGGSHTHGGYSKFVTSSNDIEVNPTKRVYPAKAGSGDSGTWWVHANKSKDSGGGIAEHATTEATSIAHTHKVTVAAKNATQAHTNMPPYLAVNIWLRTK